MKKDFRVGSWLVAPSLNTISGKGMTIRLEPKVMGVLVCLAEHPGETLPKETIFHCVWPDTFVTDDVLTIGREREHFESDKCAQETLQCGGVCSPSHKGSGTLDSARQEIH